MCCGTLGNMIECAYVEAGLKHPLPCTLSDIDLTVTVVWIVSFLQKTALLSDIESILDDFSLSGSETSWDMHGSEGALMTCRPNVYSAMHKAFVVGSVLPARVLRVWYNLHGFSLLYSIFPRFSSQPR